MKIELRNYSNLGRKKLHLTFIVSALFIFSTNLKAEHPNFNLGTHFITYGPAVHLNFWGDKKPTISWGLEASYWAPFGEGIGSINIGFEVEKKKIRIYSEVQKSVVLVGASAGVFIQISRNGQLDLDEDTLKFTYGFQGELWAGAFGYIDLKFRLAKNGSAFAPGVLVRAFHDLDN